MAGRQHGGLARQPLLLTLLSIYATDGRTDEFRAEDLSEAELCRRLLDSFIARQVRNKAPAELSESECRVRQDELRRDLAVAAFAMFNRGQQFVTEDDLERDLAALSPELEGAERASFGEPVSRARRTAAAFFFIHSAQADQHDQVKSRRTYEFLHATFGEYLIAERTLSLVRRIGEEFTLTRSRAFGGRTDVIAGPPGLPRRKRSSHSFRPAAPPVSGPREVRCRG